MDSSFRWNDDKGWIPALNSLRLLKATRDDGYQNRMTSIRTEQSRLYKGVVPSNRQCQGS
jgi:hypothetical protein